MQNIVWYNFGLFLGPQGVRFRWGHINKWFRIYRDIACMVGTKTIEKASAGISLASIFGITSVTIYANSPLSTSDLVKSIMLFRYQAKSLKLVTVPESAQKQAIVDNWTCFEVSENQKIGSDKKVIKVRNHQNAYLSNSCRSFEQIRVNDRLCTISCTNWPVHNVVRKHRKQSREEQKACNAKSQIQSKNNQGE